MSTGVPMHFGGGNQDDDGQGQRPEKSDAAMTASGAAQFETQQACRERRSRRQFFKCTYPLARLRRAEGSVLIIVLWISFGLVSLALYFGHSMMMELRAGDNRAAAVQADQTIEGAARYLLYVLKNLEEPGQLPDESTYLSQQVPVGDGAFWVVGRASDGLVSQVQPHFGLIDEAGKVNLNTATVEMLQALPNVTPELAAAIVDWRDADEEITPNGAESETYLRRSPSYRCKNAKFESIEELRLVNGATPEILDGEDANRNGILDPEENDGAASLPLDDQDGRLDPGLLEYVTVYSREANTRADGSKRINVNTAITELNNLLRETFGAERANQIQLRLGQTRNFRSLIEFYTRSQMTAEEFARISSEITITDDEYIEGLINVNTASEAVLACLPGIGPDKAASIVAYRKANATELNSIAWLARAIDQESLAAAGAHVTGRSYQFSADISAVGANGRGYRRAWFVFDVTSADEPKIVYRRDRSGLGWGLGPETLQQIQLAKEWTRR